MMKSFGDYISSSVNAISNFRNDYSNTQILKQKQKKDNKQIQLQDQNNSNRLLMILLSSAENLAAKLNSEIQREYVSHDFGHSFEIKSINKLLLQFIEQIEIFESSYKRYCKEYNSYDFPYDEKKKQGLSYQEIISDLKYWKSCVGPKYKKYYQSIIDIFNNKIIPDFSEDINNISGIDDLGKEQKCNPKELREVYPILLEQAYSEKKKIAQNYSKNKNYKIIINKKEHNNNYEYESKINKRLQKNKMNILEPEKAKNDIKYKPIYKFNKTFSDFPLFVSNNLQNLYPINEYSYNVLNSWLTASNKDNLDTILTDFYNRLGVSLTEIRKIVNYICDEIYKEITFDNK